MNNLSVDLVAAGATDIGRKRDHNEDAYFCDTTSGLFIVADGIGGNSGGDTASKAVVTVLPAILNETLSTDRDFTHQEVESVLDKALRRLSQNLVEHSNNIPELAGMGSTAVVLLVRGGTAYVAYAGDSRGYLLRDSKLLLLSEDQTTAAALVRAGHLKPEVAERHPLRHVLEEYVGRPGEITPGIVSRPLRPRDRWLLCSDGLTKGLCDDELHALLMPSSEPEELCQKLIAAANAADGSDNITALVVDIG